MKGTLKIELFVLESWLEDGEVRGETLKIYDNEIVQDEKVSQTFLREAAEHI